ncbi:MAG: LysE family translocator [Leptospirales bacterium]|nr:LysE family translocator [Leptospirales bacterium]
MDYPLTLKMIVTVFLGITIGMLSMIPVGGVQLQVIKKSLNGHLRAAIMTALGSVTSDGIYGVLVLFGFSAFMMKKGYQITLYSLGIMLLTILLIKMHRDRNKPVQETTPKYHGRISFVSGFSIAITNPGMLIWWIIGYHFFLDLALFKETTTAIKTLFLVSALAGLGGYLIVVALVVYKLKKSFSDRLLKFIHIFILTVLTFLILYFIFKLICAIFNIDTGL